MPKKRPTRRPVNKKSRKATRKVASNKTEAAFSRLVAVMHKLRAPGGCPWDAEQTHASLMPHLIEETYEVVDAVNSGEMARLKDELGDILLQVVFHAEMANETKLFDVTDVINGIHDKLVRRHPHVFGDRQGVKTADNVKKVWAEEKRKEGKKSVLGGIPKSMPALQRAWRLNEKASQVGFDWRRTEEVLDKLTEERRELEAALASGDTAHVMEEFGDLMFCMINLSRFLKIDPEQALHGTNEKFIRRFGYMEEQAEKSGRHLEKMTLDEQEALYQEARRQESRR